MRKEAFDGVIVVYTDKMERDLDGREYPIIEFYDENGYKFHGNFQETEQAESEVEFYQQHGINAELGPAAPCQVNGRVYSNNYDCVGVYLENTPDLDERLLSIMRDYIDFTLGHSHIKVSENVKKKTLSLYLTSYPSMFPRLD